MFKKNVYDFDPPLLANFSTDQYILEITDATEKSIPSFNSMLSIVPWKTAISTQVRQTLSTYISFDTERRKSGSWKSLEIRTIWRALVQILSLHFLYLLNPGCKPLRICVGLSP